MSISYLTGFDFTHFFLFHFSTWEYNKIRSIYRFVEDIICKTRFEYLMLRKKQNNDVNIEHCRMFFYAQKPSKYIVQYTK